LIAEWQDSVIVARLAPEIAERGLNLHDLTTFSLQQHPGHTLPAAYERMLDDFIGA
ncbi:MAG: hypothetical protein GXP02_10260, partial [Alphaproteobacteria bacterium]|nr:hypothetical protein [Alphaproteobacteria bacterium]